MLGLRKSGLVIAAAALAAGCSSTRAVVSSARELASDARELVSLDRTSELAPVANISETAALSLPLPPNYPETQTVLHSVRARYGERDAAFDAILSLSPELVEIVITAAAGPRLATITWDVDGVRQERALVAPGDIPVENILADIFVALWPREEVERALPPDCAFTIDDDGARTISQAGAPILEVHTNASAIVVRNLAFGYELSIVSTMLDG